MRSKKKNGQANGQANGNAQANGIPTNGQLLTLLSSASRYSFPEESREIVKERYERLHNCVALDCEMIQTKNSSNSVARCSIVNFFGDVLLDVYVRPNSSVVDYRTRWSGISPRVLEKAEKEGKLWALPELREFLLEKVFSNGVTLVGHAIHNDLKALGFPQRPAIDTQQRQVFGDAYGLRNLMKKHFDLDIQKSKYGHDSVEDARATMLLFRAFRSELEPVQ